MTKEEINEAFDNGYIYPNEKEFLESQANRKWVLSEKQQAWLDKIEYRISSKKRIG